LVEWVVDGTPAGPTAVDVSSGTATLELRLLSAGTHTVQGLYQGNDRFQGASTSLSQAIGQAQTSTQLDASASEATPLDDITFTATVALAPPAAGSASGRVRFTSGTTDLGTAGVDALGRATLVTRLAAGEHSVVAAYEGTSDIGGSTSPGVAVAVRKLATNSTLSASVPSPSLYGQNVVFTAIVSSPSGSAPSGGLVRWSIGGVEVGRVALSGGQASYSPTQLSAGDHTVVSTYEGSTSFEGSSASLDHTVRKATTSAAIQSPSPSPSVYGDAVTFTATVSAESGAPPATGEVSWRVDGAEVSREALASSGRTTYTAPQTLGAGAHEFTLHYLGYRNFVESRSQPVTQNVAKAPTATALEPNGTLSTYGQALTLVATVSASFGTPEGTVTFTADGVSLGSADLNGGRASLTTAVLPAGDRAITAAYAEGDNHLASGAPPVSHRVEPAPLTVAANDAVTQYSDPLPAFSATYSGFVLDEGPDVLAGTLHCTTSATLESSAEPYPVTCGGQASPNYGSPPSEPVVVLFFEPGSQFVTAAGTLPGPGGTKAKVGVTARYNKGDRALGRMSFQYRGTYQGVPVDFVVRSTALSALSFGATDQGSATLEGKATIEVLRLSDRAVVASEGNATFSATVHDGGESASPDTFALKVYGSDGTVRHRLDATPFDHGQALVQDRRR
jgi:hypothetical protein